MEIIYIVIPAFEPEAGLYLRIRKMTERIPAQIIVIDDGSGRDYRKIFDQIEGTGYCTVLRHDKNRGKGSAVEIQVWKLDFFCCVPCSVGDIFRGYTDRFPCI